MALRCVAEIAKLPSGDLRLSIGDPDINTAQAILHFYLAPGSEPNISYVEFEAKGTDITTNSAYTAVKLFYERGATI